MSSLQFQNPTLNAALHLVVVIPLCHLVCYSFATLLFMTLTVLRRIGQVFSKMFLHMGFV